MGPRSKCVLHHAPLVPQAPVLAAAFSEFAAYAGRPPATEEEALGLLRKQLKDASSKEEEEEAPRELEVGRTAWHVSNDGHIYEVMLMGEITEEGTVTEGDDSTTSP